MLSHSFKSGTYTVEQCIRFSGYDVNTAFSQWDALLIMILKPLNNLIYMCHKSDSNTRKTYLLHKIVLYK